MFGGKALHILPNCVLALVSELLKIAYTDYSKLRFLLWRAVCFASVCAPSKVDLEKTSFFKNYSAPFLYPSLMINTGLSRWSFWSRSRKLLQSWWPSLSPLPLVKHLKYFVGEKYQPFIWALVSLTTSVPFCSEADGVFLPCLILKYFIILSV